MGLSKKEFLDVTNKISPEKFIAIKNFILKYGDRRTYCNMYNQNPHYAFEGFDVYLSPAVGQQNINCDSSKSDFNGITIHDSYGIYDKRSPMFGCKNLSNYFSLTHFYSKDNIASKTISNNFNFIENHVYLSGRDIAEECSQNKLESVILNYFLIMEKSIKSKAK